MPIRYISSHALERLKQRRKVTHPIRAQNKILKWGGAILEDNGYFWRKGYLYVVVEQTLITMYPLTLKRVAGYRYPVTIIEE